MAKFIVEQYQIYTNEFNVEAENLEEAIKKFENSDCYYREKLPLHIDVAEDKGFRCGIRSIESEDGEVITHEFLKKMFDK